MICVCAMCRQIDVAKEAAADEVATLRARCEAAERQESEVLATARALAARVTELEAALRFGEALLSAHRPQWLHDEGEDCRDCEYEVLLARFTAALGRGGKAMIAQDRVIVILTAERDALRARCKAAEAHLASEGDRSPPAGSEGSVAPAASDTGRHYCNCGKTFSAPNVHGIWVWPTGHNGYPTERCAGSERATACGATMTSRSIPHEEFVCELPGGHEGLHATNSGAGWSDAEGA